MEKVIIIIIILKYIFCGRVTPFTVVYIRYITGTLISSHNDILAVDCEWRYHSFIQSCHAFFLKDDRPV